VKTVCRDKTANVILFHTWIVGDYVVAPMGNVWSLKKVKAIHIEGVWGAHRPRQQVNGHGAGGGSVAKLFDERFVPGGWLVEKKRRHVDAKEGAALR
jgi:hypothetical protein